jgi:hypothetical protein
MLKKVVSYDYTYFTFTSSSNNRCTVENIYRVVPYNYPVNVKLIAFDKKNLVLKGGTVAPNSIGLKLT